MSWVVVEGMCGPSPLCLMVTSPSSEQEEGSISASGSIGERNGIGEVGCCLADLGSYAVDSRSRLL